MTTTATVGIDIADFQPDQVPGDWLFVVLKTTQGIHVANEKAAEQWAFAAQFPYRGLYHYATPLDSAEAGMASSGAIQANYFADDALARGFRPGVDMWQLDVESELNEQVTPEDWAEFVPAFMAVAVKRLGIFGFQYGPVFYGAGYYWYPNYGPNDGLDHGVPAGIPAVLHQYTSAGNLDQNHVANAVTWQNLTHPAPSPAVIAYWKWVAAMKALAAAVKSLTVRPAHYLDHGANVKLIQTQLRRHHFSNLVIDGFYGSSTVLAVHAFKAQNGWKDPDGHYCGGRCIRALLK